MLAVLLPPVLLTTHSYNPPLVAVMALMLKVLPQVSIPSFTQWNMLLGPPEVIQINVKVSPFYTVVGLAVTYRLESAVMVTL